MTPLRKLLDELNAAVRTHQEERRGPDRDYAIEAMRDIVRLEQRIFAEFNGVVEKSARLERYLSLPEGVKIVNETSHKLNTETIVSRTNGYVTGVIVTIREEKP